MVRYGFNDNQPLAVACSGICKGGGGGESLSLFFLLFFCFSIFQGAQLRKNDISN